MFEAVLKSTKVSRGGIGLRCGEYGAVFIAGELSSWYVAWSPILERGASKFSDVFPSGRCRPFLLR